MNRPNKSPWNVIKLSATGLIFAISGEIFDNLIINHRSPFLFAVILPIYTLFFILIYSAHQRLKYSYFWFTIIFGITAWVVIENLILQKFAEPWPIQVFMLSYWISIISYPYVVVDKKSWRLIIIPLIIALIISLLSHILQFNLFLSLALFQFFFWIASAFSNLLIMKRFNE